MKKDSPLLSLPKRQAKAVALLDDPKIGHMTAIILKTIDRLGSEAYGLNVVETLSGEAGVWVDPAQVYASIRKLSTKAPPLIELAEIRKQKDGAPQKIYRLTQAGHDALAAVLEHHRQLAKYLQMSDVAMAEKKILAASKEANDEV